MLTDLFQKDKKTLGDINVGGRERKQPLEAVVKVISSWRTYPVPPRTPLSFLITAGSRKVVSDTISVGKSFLNNT